MEKITAPDYASPLTGWRFWKIRKTPRDGKLWLRSVIRNELWPPMKRFEADCSSYREGYRRGSPPQAHSQCGIYAFKTPLYAIENLNRFCYRGTLLGKVNMWGVIQKHKFGYRAQFAYPVSLSMGICCICKRTVNLKSEPFAIGWCAFHITDSFSVSGFLCEDCNVKYYSLEIDSGYKELSQLLERYSIRIE